MSHHQLTPFELAQLLRNLAHARRQNHPIAVAIAAAGPLPNINAAAWFRRITSGTPKCDFTTPASQPPCTADALFAVSGPPNPDAIQMACPHHLNALTSHGVSAVTRLMSRPHLRRAAARLQQAYLQLRQQLPNTETLQTVAALKAELFPLDPIFHDAAHRQ